MHRDGVETDIAVPESAGNGVEMENNTVGWGGDGNGWGRGQDLRGGVGMISIPVTVSILDRRIGCINDRCSFGQLLNLFTCRLLQRSAVLGAMWSHCRSSCKVACCPVTVGGMAPRGAKGGVEIRQSAVQLTTSTARNRLY